MLPQRRTLAELDINTLENEAPTSAQLCTQRRLTHPPKSPLRTIRLLFDSERFLQDQFDAWIEALPPAMIRNLGGSGNELKMPMNSTDGRTLTWRKWVNEIVSKITNSPESTNDCWLISGFAGDTSGYPVKKISNRGNQNKWPVHRMTYFVMHPDQLDAAAGPLHCSHRCNRGRYDTAKGVEFACINPNHLTLCTAAENQDHKGCIRSQAAWCPHEPRCIYTDDDGRWLPCRNTEKRTPICVCGRDCLGDGEEDMG